MTAAMASQLECLPNEVLTQVLSRFSTKSLLPLLTLSRSLHDIVHHLLHYRLLYTWPLPTHGLILEVYHPSGKWTEPYLFCTYLGTTGGLSRSVAYEKSYDNCTGHAERCAKLNGVYSRFRPQRREDESQRTRPVMGSLSEDNVPVRSVQGIVARPQDGKVQHIVNLDSHELFSQLCLSSSLVQLGPVQGVFPSVVEAAGGVMRVWRKWLREQAEITKGTEQDGVLELDNDMVDCVEKEQGILWVNWKHDVGLKVKVREKNVSRLGSAPILEEALDSDERPVSYAIEIQELLVRQTHLNLAIEHSFEEDRSTTGKAMIFGSLGSSPSAGTSSIVTA